MTRSRAGSARLAALAAALLTAGGLASAREVDPTLAQRFTLAVPRLASRASAAPLPPELTLSWRVRVAGGILHAPVARDDGSVLVAHTLPTLAAYGPEGRLLWSARLGATPAAASPIVLGDGAALVLTESADALWISRDGRPLRQVSLPLGTLERPPVVAALDDGGLLVADGRRLVRIDAGGGITYASRLTDEVIGMLGAPGEPVLVTASGGVLVLSADGRLVAHGNLGGRVEALARLDRRRLAAVVDGRRLAELDLESRALTLLFSDPNLELSTALTANAVGELRVLGAGDWLLAFRAGREQFRVALPGAGAAPLRSVSAELLLDPRGAALVVRAGLDAVLVLPDGALARVDGTACPEPLRPAPLPSGAVVLACRSGVLSRVQGSPSRQ